MKIFLKICFFSVFFTSQSFAEQNVSGSWSQTQKNNPQVNVQNNNIVSSQGNGSGVAADPKAGVVALSQPPRIVSSINPVNQIAKFISGDEKNNSLLISPRTSEHDYQFRPSNINILNSADVVFYISDSLENNLGKALASLKKQPKVVQLSKAKNMQLLTFQTRPDEENTDVHIWLRPDNGIAIATEIANTLSALYPPSAATYKKNLERFIVDVKDMDAKNKIALFKVRKKSFIIDHNSTAYFENYYDMPSAGVMRYYHDQDLNLKDVTRINDLIKRERVVCVLGSFQERSGLAVQVAANNKIKFALIDIMGSEMNYNQNGYTKILGGLVDDLVKCVNNK